MRTLPNWNAVGLQIFCGLGGRARSEFITFAAANSLPARIVWCQTPIEIAMERNKDRALAGGAKVPAIAFYTFRKNFVAPSRKMFAGFYVFLRARLIAEPSTPRID